MGLYVGTSGFAYKEWKPGFYPPDLKAADMLRFYSARLPSVEINNTFYRTPTEKLIRDWKDQTPETFVFSLKAPRRITHVQRLRAADESLEFFIRAARILEPRLGCMLFQCPPYLRYDAALLDAFVARLPGGPSRFAMEFRHESWNADEVRQTLAAHGIARCFVEDEEGGAELQRTAKGFVYLRLRKPRYEDADIREWAKRLVPVLADGADAYVYFKHEDDPAGVGYGRRLLELASS